MRGLELPGDVEYILHAWRLGNAEVRVYMAVVMYPMKLAAFEYQKQESTLNKWYLQTWKIYFSNFGGNLAKQSWFM